MSQSNDLTNLIIDYLYKNGVFAFRVNSTGIFDAKIGKYRGGAKKGVSDILAFIRPHGRVLAIEVKIGKDKLSEEQIGFGKNIEYVGGLWFVARNFEEFKTWFESIDKHF